MAKKERNENVICENRRARFNYELLDFYEGGLVLTGPEVKSLRAGGGHINEAYASFSRGELWLIGSHIAPYDHGGYAVQEERRSRKVLLHEAELRKIKIALEREGLTLVPLRLFWSRGKAKVALAVARGKKTVDKREAIKKRDVEREARKIFKGRK
ncbi:MAG: SsrA-binding protein SmpB [Proteobacteria bacterium]|nr:SsrA-binding protein SmpB [Pseudomonadota bacterium]